MKKVLSLAALAALLLVSAAHAAPSPGGASWADIERVQFARSSGNTDSTTLVGADSVRTLGVSTERWDWSALIGASAASYAAHIVAVVTFWTPAGSAIVGDTIYFVPERGHATAGGAPQYSQNGKAIADIGAPALGNCAVLTHISGGVTEWVGYLIGDADTFSELNVMGAAFLRLKVFADKSSGAAAAQGSIYCYISPLKQKMVN
jgi:hypothetical protein